MYVPHEVAPQPMTGAPGAAQSPTPTATKGGAAGLMGNPLFWLLIVAVLWAGLVHVGFTARVEA